MVAYNLLRAHMATRLKEAEALMRELMASLGAIEEAGADGGGLA